MGWFWDSKPSTDGLDDPYSKLDPALREFLDKESPVKYQDTAPRPHQSPRPSQDAAPTTYRSQLGLDKPGLSQDHQNAAQPTDAPAVPPESLYQDGRYAHLWKSYRSQASLEASSRSDQDRLADVVDAYHDRKAAIGRAAIENCVLEQMAEKDCFTSGSWAKLSTMCREENRAFNRCYQMQSRFLKALGYLSSQRSEEEEERIQMHADKLYHEMLAREAQAEEAKKQGLPTPNLPPLIQPEETSKALGEDSAWARIRQRAATEDLPHMLSQFTPERQAEIKEKLKDMNETQKEIELQLIAAEGRAKLEYADQIKERLEAERQDRHARRERGRETVGDAIKRMWGWDK